MAIFEYDGYKIDIDEEATKKYLARNKSEIKPEYINLIEYTRRIMTKAEKAYFDFLPFDISSLELTDSYVHDNKWDGFFCTYVIGEFLAYTNHDCAICDNAFKNGINEEDIDFETDWKHFYSYIVSPEKTNYESYESKKLIFVYFSVFNIPWLLNEKGECRKEPKFVSLLKWRFTEFRDYVSRQKALVKEYRMSEKNLKTELKKLKVKYGLSYKILYDKDVLSYKEQWIDKILPANVGKSVRDEAYNVCISSRNHEVYLWHIFSYEFLDSEDNAIEKFEKLKKNNCTIVFNSENNFAVEFRNAGRLTDSDLRNLCKNSVGWCDFVITADDFSWVYSRTHEEKMCLGPYFYRKNNG